MVTTEWLIMKIINVKVTFLCITNVIYILYRLDLEDEAQGPLGDNRKIFRDSNVIIIYWKTFKPLAYFLT